MKSTDKKSLITDFTTGKISKQLIIFATPLFLSNLLQITYNVIDMVIVGKIMGKVGLSAISIGGDITGFLTFVAIGFSNAAQVIIAQYIGYGHREKIGRFIGNMISFLTFCALALCIVGFILRNSILNWMNTPIESYDEALNYATICMFGLCFIYGYNSISAVLRGMGDSKHPFVFISLSAVLNIILDIIFVAVLSWGAGGAALATVISQGTSFLCCVIFMYRNRERYNLNVTLKDFFTLDKTMLLSLIKLGLPMAIKVSSVRFSKIFVNSWLNSYGVAVSAFAGIVTNINQTTNLLSTSFNTAGASMVGQNIGAAKYDRVVKIMNTVTKITLVIATVFSLFFITSSEVIYGFFTKDPEVLEIGQKYVPIAIMLFYGAAARAGTNSLINGSGNYMVNYVTAILDGIVLRIGLALLFGLGFNMGYMGFWLGDALAGFTPFFVGIVFFYKGNWKRKIVE